MAFLRARAIVRDLAQHQRTVGAGFTLIELLVVIAIIGLLASIVLVSLSSARSKGKDAAVESGLNSIRTQAELLKGGANCYSAAGTCPSAVCIFTTTDCSGCANHMCYNTTIHNMLQSVVNNAQNSLISLQEPAGGAAYAYVIQLVSDKALAWCIDSSGQSKEEGTPGGTTLTQTSLNALILNNSTCM